MMFILRLIAFISVFSSIVGLAYASADERNVTLFDSLITKNVIAEEFGLDKPLYFSVTESNGGIRHFIAEYRFDRKSPEEHYTLNISVAVAGQFLDPIAYKHSRESEPKSDTPLEAHYPSIGLRAQRDFWGAGPGGAVYGLTFTTTDDRFDIRITISNLMPDGIEEPRFDLDKFAQRLSDRYNGIANVIKY